MVWRERSGLLPWKKLESRRSRMSRLERLVFPLEPCDLLRESLPFSAPIIALLCQPGDLVGQVLKQLALLLARLLSRDAVGEDPLVVGQALQLHLAGWEEKGRAEMRVSFSSHFDKMAEEEKEEEKERRRKERKGEAVTKFMKKL